MPLVWSKHFIPPPRNGHTWLVMFDIITQLGIRRKSAFGCVVMPKDCAETVRARLRGRTALVAWLQHVIDGSVLPVRVGQVLLDQGQIPAEHGQVAVAH